MGTDPAKGSFLKRLAFRSDSATSLYGKLFFPAGIDVLPSIGVSLTLYGQTASPPWTMLWGAPALKHGGAFPSRCHSDNIFNKKTVDMP